MDTSIKTFTAADGAEIRYVDEGSGTPVIYVYGMGSSIATSGRLADEMKAHCRFIVFDQRGIGLTKAAGEIGIWQSARDVRDLIEKLALRQVILFGYSMGAIIVLAYMQQFGCEGLGRVLLGDAPPKLINEKGWNLGLYQGHYTREMFQQDLNLIRTDYRRFALIFAEQLMFLSTAETVRDFTGTAEEVWNRILSRRPNPLTALSLFSNLIELPEEYSCYSYDYWKSMGEADFREMLCTISVTAGLLYADPGSCYSPAAAEYMHSRIPESILMPMHDCTHMAATEKPEEFVRYLTAFVTEK